MTSPSQSSSAAAAEADAESGSTLARPRSRRALLAAGAGGAAAVVAALTRPARVAAAVGDPIRAGKSTSAGGAKTTLTNNSNTHQTLFVQQNGRHTALQGYAPKGTAGRFTTNSKNKYAVSVVNNAGSTGTGAALRADGNANYGIWASSGPSIGLLGSSSSNSGVVAAGNGAKKFYAALRAVNGNYVDGMAAYLQNASAFATAHFRNDGSGQVLWLENGGTDANGTGGGDFITAVNHDAGDHQFRVATTGEAFSDVGFNAGGADFAEMLPVLGGTAPGDVLVLNRRGRLSRSRRAHDPRVAGVYSTKPGFVAGSRVDGQRAPGHAPVAVVGIVPVKASAENGPIQPGDLLTTSGTPGHAMRAGAHPAVGTVLGKAMGSLDAGTGKIRALVLAG